MKVEYKKTSIQIIPENGQDEIYLEAVLDLHKNGNRAIAERIGVMGFDYEWVYLEIKKSNR